MDALETLSGSALDSKAERIARYKAERRRELAERYANLEDLSSKYTRRERHRDNDAPEVTICTRGQPAEGNNKDGGEDEKEVQSETNKKQETATRSRQG